MTAISSATSVARVPREGLLVSAPAPAAPADSVEIIGAEQLPADRLEKLKTTAAKATQFFAEHFGSVTHPVKLDVRADQAALRTGYNTKTDTVCFPPLANVKNAGLDSVDIINHEIFHALMYQSYPKNSGNDLETTRMHEGLADYFAYQLNPDERFAEDFLVNKPELRFYRNDLEVSLAAGPHMQGNAITSLLLKDQVGPDQVRSFLERGDFSLAGLASISPEVKADVARDASFKLVENASPYPLSGIRRYRISDEQPLQITFTPNESLKQAHPNLSIKWSTLEGGPSKHYRITATGTDQFSIAKTPNAEPEKVLALLYDGEKLVGSRPFYFSGMTGTDGDDWMQDFS